MHESRRGSLPARLAVYAAAAWLVAWAGMKLFLGTPTSLPETVREMSPFDADLTFRVAIAIELSIFFLALIKPHLGWVPLATIYAFFVALLVPMVAAGAESCGCGGGAVKMKPIVMLSVDAALLVAVLATRPWKTLKGPGLSTVALVVGIAASWAAPFVLIRSSSDSQGPIVVDTKTGEVTSAGSKIDYVMLHPEKWNGQAAIDIAELTRWIDPSLMPVEGAIVFWRQGCDHCAKHLRELASKDDGSRQYLLVQVRDDLDSGRSVDAMPQGAHVSTFEFPEKLGVALTTPVQVEVKGGNVTGVLYEKDFQHAGG